MTATFCALCLGAWEMREANVREMLEFWNSQIGNAALSYAEQKHEGHVRV